MDYFTLDEFASFSEKDLDFNEILGLKAPSDKSVRNILSYAAGLSVRSSKKMDKITMILN